MVQKLRDQEIDLDATLFRSAGEIEIEIMVDSALGGNGHSRSFGILVLRPEKEIRGLGEIDFRDSEHFSRNDRGQGHRSADMMDARVGC